jgi:hypothetical protein
MSTDRPAPPSIPPRKKQAGAPGPRPSGAAPKVVHAVPTAAREPRLPAAPQPAADQLPSVPVQPGESTSAGTAPSHPGATPRTSPPLTGPAAPAPRLPAPTTTTASRTGAVKKALKSASVAVAGAAAAVTGEAMRTTGSPTGIRPRPDSTKTDPTIAATDAHAAATPPGHQPTAATPGGAPGTAAGGARTPAPATVKEGAPRRVRLSVSRVDPWSVMKLSFLLSVGIGIMIVVAAAVVWFVLDGLAVFTQLNDLVTQIVGKESPVDILQYVAFSKVVSGATVVAVVDVVLLTALSTIGAFLYNITAALVGGVTLTLTDD